MQRYKKESCKPNYLCQTFWIFAFSSRHIKPCNLATLQSCKGRFPICKSSANDNIYYIIIRHLSPHYGSISCKNARMQDCKILRGSLIVEVLCLQGISIGVPVILTMATCQKGRAHWPTSKCWVSWASGMTLRIRAIPKRKLWRKIGFKNLKRV